MCLFFAVSSERFIVMFYNFRKQTEDAEFDRKLAEIEEQKQQEVDKTVSPTVRKFKEITQ